MIDWNRTKDLYHIDKPICGRYLALNCDKCGSPGEKKLMSLKRLVNNDLPWVCRKCSRNTPEFKAKMSESLKKACGSAEFKQKTSENSLKMWQNDELKRKISGSIKQKWEDPEYAEKISNKTKSSWQDDDFRSKISRSSKAAWQDGEYRQKQEKSVSTRLTKFHSTCDDPKWKESASVRSKKHWDDPNYRKRESDTSREQMLKQWQNPEYRAKMCSRLDKLRESMPRVSSLQTTLYSVLDDLGIEYLREDRDGQCKIGPYWFDCVIPGAKTLLIECQGNYWHDLKEVALNDRQKSSYIANNFPDHEIKYLWEHEFKCKDKIVELVKYWTGMTCFELVDFSFDQIQIRDCPAADYRSLLSKYHYLPNAGRGGISLGAYLNETLIAVCIFSPLGRQNLPYDSDSTRELSRLCIHPRYQKKNFASWFVSHCVGQLDEKYTTIISYCDTTFNHDGTTYKACNFIQDGIVPSDYWYVDKDGWVMHKKTLYGHAIKMKLKEAAYAEKYGYWRVYGKEKLRFRFDR